MLLRCYPGFSSMGTMAQKSIKLEVWGAEARQNKLACIPGSSELWGGFAATLSSAVWPLMSANLSTGGPSLQPQAGGATLVPTQGA